MTGVLPPGFGGEVFLYPPKTANRPSDSDTTEGYQRGKFIDVPAAIVLLLGVKIVVRLFAKLRVPLTVRSPPVMSTFPLVMSDCPLQKMSVEVVLDRTECEFVPVPSAGFQT